MDLFNHFDTYFEKHIKARKDLHVEQQDSEDESTPPLPKDALLQILRVIRVVLDNCTNIHFFTSYEVINAPSLPPYVYIYAFFLTGIFFFCFIINAAASFSPACIY